MKLYKHKNNKDIAAQVLKITRIPGKDYARIKARWWNIGPHRPFDMKIEQMLTDATKVGNKKERTKYPLAKWLTDWAPYHSDTHR